MTIRNLLPNPPISQAIQRTTPEATDVLTFLANHGIVDPTFLPGSNDPDLITNGDDPGYFNISVPTGHWVVATPRGGGNYTLQAMDTTELEQRYNDLYTG